MKLKSVIKFIVATTLSISTTLCFAETNVESGYVRAVPPGQMNSAAFMKISNSNDTAIALIGAKSPAAKNVELHTHTNDNGVMQMRQVERFNIPAKGSATLQPGGNHIMLIGLLTDLVPESAVELTLEYSDGSTQLIKIPVSRVAPMQQGHHHHH